MVGDAPGMRVTVYFPPYFVGLKLRLSLACGHTDQAIAGIHIALNSRICWIDVSGLPNELWDKGMILHLTVDVVWAEAAHRASRYCRWGQSLCRNDGKGVHTCTVWGDLIDSIATDTP